MAQALTQGQIKRRLAILNWLETRPEASADRIRSHLAQDQGIYVTVDTVQRDLKAMEAAGTVAVTARAWRKKGRTL